MTTTMPAERRSALRVDTWEGTVEAVMTREQPRRSRTSGEHAPAADAASRHRKTAIIVGVLFIIGDIAGVLSLLVTRGLLEGPDALTKIAAHQNQLVLGALLVLVMGFALAMVPVVMYPGTWMCRLQGRARDRRLHGDRRHLAAPPRTQS
jgi:hypothetical protein